MLNLHVFLFSVLICSMAVTMGIGVYVLLAHRWFPMRVAGLVVAILSFSLIVSAIAESLSNPEV